MNKARRKELGELFNRVRVLLTEVENLPGADDMHAACEDIKSAEESYRDNMPENMANGEKGERATECCDNLDTASTALEEIATAITTLKDDLQEALDAIDDARAE